MKTVPLQERLCSSGRAIRVSSIVIHVAENMDKTKLFDVFFLIILNQVAFCSINVVFASSENWVEVTTLTGAGGIGSTKSFTIDHVDWRIKWEIAPGNSSERTAFLAYLFPVTGIKGSEPWFEQIELYGTEETTGILTIYNNTGSFYMDVLTGNVDYYKMIIEQNIDSVPEFSSLIILPLFAVVTLAVTVCKKLLRSKKATVTKN